MVDFALSRRAMIDSQVSAGGVTEFRLLTAMGRIPREIFVPAHRRDLAYIDDHHILAGGRFVSSPATFGRLVQLAGPAETDTVLDVGAATGYSTAVLASLSREVVGLEANADLAEQATANLSELALSNATITSGDVADLGDRTFDVIIVEGMLDARPDHLLSRLRPGGRLVALIRRGLGGVATRFVADSGGYKKETHFDATLPALDTGRKADEFIF